VIPWRPISELPDQLKDGRPVLLWISWEKMRSRYQSIDDPDEPVAAKWYSPGGAPTPERGGWVLTQTGAYAEDDDVSGEITHYAEIQAP
jgi:hypothetical protein